MSETITASLTVSGGDTITVNLNTLARGPAGTGGGGSNSVTSATTSDGTANLSISNVTTATAEVTGTLTANHIHGNLAGNVYAHVRAGETLTKGDPVYVSGSHGSGSTLIAIVSKADASNAAKMPAVGIMDADLAHNATGHMVITGTITELATNAYSVNAELYVAAGGGMTATPPTARAQPVARVERSNANNGAILVKVNGLSASDATASTLVRRDASGGASFGTVTADWIATAAFEANGISGGIFFDGSSYIYTTGSEAIHRTALGSGATGDELFTAATPAAARTTLGQITATSTAQIDSVAYTVGGTPVTGIQSIQLEADTLYELSWYGKFTSNGGSGYLWLNFSSAYDDLGNNGFQQFARFHNTVGSTFLVSTTAIAAAFANLGTLTTRTAHGSIRFKTVLATQVSLGWSQWNGGTVTGTSSLLTAFRVGIRPV